MAVPQTIVQKEDDLNRRFNMFIANMNWINRNLDELKTCYPDLYIAVQRKKVIASSENLSDLKEKIRKMNIDLDTVTIEFIKRSPLKLLV